MATKAPGTQGFPVHEKIQKEMELAKKKASQPRVKFQIVSDLHFEGSVGEGFDRPNGEYLDWPPGGWPVLAPYLILAGDIGLLGKHYNQLHGFLSQRCKEYQRVFYVLGNNEFPSNYETYSMGIQAAKKISRDPSMGGKLWLLNRDRFDIKENGAHIVLVGCTLWTLIRDDQLPFIKKDHLDYITENTPSSHNMRFRQELAWLKRTVEEIRREKGGEERKIMIITHHPPFIRGASRDNHDVSATYSRNYSMYSNDILGGAGFPGLGVGDMWVYGHTHYSNDLVVDDVRVYSNQRGGDCPKLIADPKVHDFDLRRVVSF